MGAVEGRGSLRGDEGDRTPDPDTASVENLGFKTTFTLNNRLVKASQITGKPIPSFKQNQKGKKGPKRVEVVEVKKRGKGNAFDVNIPQEPLMRAGVNPGDKLKVSVRGKTISLTVGE